eukprot:148745-Alexandrium_andersonii.AAC.1
MPACKRRLNRAKGAELCLPRWKCASRPTEAHSAHVHTRQKRMGRWTKLATLGVQSASTTPSRNLF